MKPAWQLNCYAAFLSQYYENIQEFDIIISTIMKEREGPYEKEYIFNYSAIIFINHDSLFTKEIHNDSS